MSDDIDLSKLSFEDQCLHKAWKVRVNGYEEITKLFSRLDDPKSNEYSKYSGFMKVYASESNVIAQEKALGAVLAFMENSSLAPRIINDVASSIIQKCFTTRPKSKELGMEILMIGIEIEKQDIIVEELLKGTNNKTPKIVVASVQILRDAINAFGPKIIQIKPIIKQIPLLLDHRDPVIREEGKNLVISMYQWLGDVIKPSLKSLKPIQLQDLELEFAKITEMGIKMIPTRYLRSQRSQISKGTIDGGVCTDVPDSTGEVEKEIDAFELIEAVDVLAAISKTIWDKAQEKAWQARKEAMEAMGKILDTPKYEAGDYGDLIKLLKTLISKDTNIIVVAQAGDNLAKVALGLRKKFAPYAPNCVNAILEKFKEKKANVVTALRTAIDAIYTTTNLEAISEEVLTHIANKNPAVRFETVSFLSRSLAKCNAATLNKKLVKTLTSALVISMNDSDPTVREVTAESLGIMMKIVGERVMTPLISDLEKLKIEKIKECSDKHQPQNQHNAGSKSKAPAAATRATEPPKLKDEGKVGGKAKIIVPPAASDKPKAGAAGKKRATTRTAEPENFSKNDMLATSAITETPLSSDEAMEMALEYFAANVLNDLSSNDWKERLAAVGTISDVVKSMGFGNTFPTQVIVQVICKKPGLKDTNFQVARLKLELLSEIVGRGKWEATGSDIKFSKTSSDLILPDLVEKLGDAKNGVLVCELLSQLCETWQLGFRDTTLDVLKMAFERKNPKLQSEALLWACKALPEFGLAPYFTHTNVRALVEACKTALSASNPAVRNAGIALVTTLHVYCGALRPPLAVIGLFQDQKPAILQQLQASVDGLAVSTPVTATRGLNSRADTINRASENEGANQGQTSTRINETGVQSQLEEEDEGAQARTDISAMLDTSLLTEMAHKDWKVRKEAITKVQALLAQNPHITPNVVDFAACLKARILGESNKNLTPVLLALSQNLVEAMGKQCITHFGTLLPPTLHCMGDSKPNVRKAASEAATAWLERCSYPHFFESNALSEALKVDNPFQRAEVITWMTENLFTLPIKTAKIDAKPVVGEIYGLVEDRNPEVRKAALNALKPLVKLLSYDGMVKILKSTHPKSTTILPVLEGIKTELGPCNAVSSSIPKVVPKMASKNQPSLPEPSSNQVKQETKDDHKKAPTLSGSAKNRRSSENPLENLFLDKVNKETRFKDEHNFKILRWNFPSPKPEYINQLRDLLEHSVNAALLNLLFHKDAKFRIKALDALQGAVQCNLSGTLNALDLILKWVTLQFYDTNTTLLLKCYEYLLCLEAALVQHGYVLHDLEASSFVPYLVGKAGDTKELLRKQNRAVTRLLYQVYPASKAFPFILEGVKSKNSKQRQDCLEEIEFLLSVYGTSVCQNTLNPTLKLIAVCTNDRDNNVRLPAYNIITTFYTHLGEALYKHLSHLPVKDLVALEERIKKTLKSQPPAPAPVLQQVTTSPGKGQPATTIQESPRGESHRESWGRHSRGSPPVQETKITPPKGTYKITSTAKNKYFNFDPKYAVDLAQALPDPSPVNLIDMSETEELMNRPVIFPKYERYKINPPSRGSDWDNLKEDANTIGNTAVKRRGISQIASGNMEESRKALTSLEEELASGGENFNEILGPHFDQLLMSANGQLKILTNRHIPSLASAPSDSFQLQPVLHLYTHLLALLTRCFTEQQLAKRASRDVLYDLILTCIASLTDPGLEGLACGGGTLICRKLNVVIIKIIENSDPTHVICLLVQGLHSAFQQTPPQTSPMPDRSVQLVMKCVWKAIKLLPRTLDTGLQIDKVLCECHAFMRDYPSSFWKTRDTDIPLRTVKTLVHALTKSRGEAVLNAMTFFKDPTERDRSDLYHYVLKVLKVENKQVTLDPGSMALKSPASEAVLPQQVQDELRQIFKNIGCRETSQAGLEMLYEFKKAHPQFDMDSKLTNTAPRFRTYVEQGLAQIGERRGDLDNSDGPPGNLPLKSGPVIAKLIKPEHMDMGEWHAVLKAKLLEHEEIIKNHNATYYPNHELNLHPLDSKTLANALKDPLKQIERCREDFIILHEKLATK